MPARNVVKSYVSDSFYHLYNRGANKQEIFRDEQDYQVLILYLSQYLLPKDENYLLSVISNPLANYKEKEKAQKLLRLNNFSDTIQLHAYSLMPNHFHMQVYQTENNAIDRFMNSLWTRYSMYFNKKYQYVGRIFQSLYKGSLITNDNQNIHLSRYIHLNPIAHRRFRNPASKGSALRGYLFSSYLDYLNLRSTPWIHTEEILGHFNNNPRMYQDFVESYENDEETALTVAPIMIED
jgi:putative transposase